VFAESALYIATALYSVSTGWTAWTYAATSQGFSAPNVAINNAGDAFLIYAAQPCSRVGIPPVPGLCRDPQRDTQNIYGLKALADAACVAPFKETSGGCLANGGSDGIIEGCKSFV
jgi:hypothetical protein